MAPHMGGMEDMEGMGGMGGMGMGRMGSGSIQSLSPDGVDFHNETQAANFLAEMLDDDELKIIGNAYARYFWYGIAAAVAVAATSNLTRRLTLRSRLRAAARGQQQPAKPRHPVMLAMATATAMVREATYLQFTPTRQRLGFKVPPIGILMLLLTYFAFVLVLEFANNDVAGAQFWQARGVRAGWLAVAQVPLLILLVMKTNIVGFITGVSHERLNVLHRWASRITLFLAILHFGYQSYGWQQFGLMKLEWATDSCPPTGIAAFALLLWINLSNLVPFRFWSYEVFVIQHIISFFGFIIAVMYHLPSTALWSRIYIYIPIALYLIDRIVRTALFSYKNAPSGKATLSLLDGEVTKVIVSNKRVKHWAPGSFVLLSIPRFGIIETHPATIASTPTSHNGDLVFILKSRRGFTKRIRQGASSCTRPMLPTSKQESEDANVSKTSYRAYLNGPYGGSHSDFAAFDSVCLFSGSTGVTFTLAILQDLAERAAALPQGKLPVRRVHFVWCVKDVSWTQWCKEEISSAFRKLRAAGIDVEVSVHVTCADAFTEPGNELKECDCACDKSLGPCCCTVVEEDDEDQSSSADAIKSATEEGKKDTAAVSVAVKDTSAVSLSALPCASFYSGRPEIAGILLDVLEGAEGESGVAVCGPTGLNAAVRNSVVRLSDERAIHKGSGCQGVYLHVEAFD